MIREAIRNYERSEYIENIAFQIKEELSLRVNEESIGDLKKQVVKLLGDVDDYETVNDVLTVLYKEQFEEKFTEIASSKGIDGKTMDEFKSYFYNTSGKLEEKLEFLDAVAGEGIWSESAIVSATTPISLSSGKVQLVNNTFISAITEKLKFWKASLGAKSGVGAGEGIFIMYVKGAGKANVGDIQIGGKTWEVKANSKPKGASGGRLLGTTNEWIKPPSVFGTAMNLITDMAAAKGISVNPSKNDFGFLKSTLDNWNKVLKGDKKSSVALLTKIISMMYVNKGVSLKWIEKNVKKDGTIDESFMDAFLVYQFEYYQKMEGFNGVIFFSMVEGNVCTLTKASEFEKMVKAGRMNYGGFNWQQDRNLAYQVGLKG